MKPQNKYKGEFNYCGETYTLYTWAIHKDRAFNNFISKLPQEIRAPAKLIRQHFIYKTTDNYRISKLLL